MLLARGVDVGEAHRAAQENSEYREHHEAREETPHEIERAEEIAHPFRRQRHDQVEAEQAVPERVREYEERGFARDPGCVFGSPHLLTARYLTHIGTGVVTDETPRKPREEDQDRAIPHEEPLAREPPADLRPRLVNPCEDVLPTDDQPYEQQQCHRRE